MPRLEMSRELRRETAVYAITLAAAMAALLGWGWLMQRRSRKAEDVVTALSAAKASLEQRARERSDDLKHATRRLAILAADKDALYHEVHHRVKNNLQVVSSLLHLQAARLAPEIRRPFDESASRIGAMSLVHEIIYRSDQPSRIDFAHYLRAVAEAILANRGAERIALVLDAEPAYVDLDTAVPLALIANELIGNAVESAFPNERQGTLKLNLAAGDEGLSLIIADDGVDKDESVPPPPFGGLMVNTLASQIGATVTSHGDGIRFLIFVPRHRRRSE